MEYPINELKLLNVLYSIIKKLIVEFANFCFSIVFYYNQINNPLSAIGYHFLLEQYINATIL